MAGMLTNLQACCGPDRVVDVFENTGIALKARDLNIGCYVVRGVLTSAQLAAWHQALTNSVAFIANKQGSRAVDLKGDRSGPAAYRTIQCTIGSCTCKYDYEGTARNLVFKTDKVAPFKAVCDWLHDAHRVVRKDHFDALVANIYSRAANQCAGVHTDQSELLGETSNIMSVSMGAAGVFDWRPSSFAGGEISCRVRCGVRRQSPAAPRPASLAPTPRVAPANSPDYRPAQPPGPPRFRRSKPAHSTE